MRFPISVLLLALLATTYSVAAYGPIYNSTNSTTPTTTNVMPTLTSAAVPTFTLFNSTTKMINATKGGVVAVRDQYGENLTVTIAPGTYALWNSTKLSTYNFTVATFNTSGVNSPGQNQTVAYGFAYEVNHQINASVELVDANSTAMPVMTTAKYPASWTSWAWVGGTLNGTKYVGGNYSAQNTWTYNATNGTITNVEFSRPIMWVFTIIPATKPLNTTNSTTTVAPTSTVPTSTVSAPSTTSIAQTTPGSNNTLLIVGVIIVIIIIAIVAYMMMKK